MLRACARLVLVGLLAAAARAGVTVVDGDFFVLQTAIDAAADGDILLLKPGSGGFISGATIDGKSLTLVVDGGSYNLGHLTVSNVPAGGQVTLRGLTISDPIAFFYTAFPESGGIEVRDCAGSVWIDACSIVAAPQSPGGFAGSLPGAHGLFALNSADVVLSDGSVTGGVGAFENGSCTIPGYAPSSRGGDGVRARDSNVALLRMQVTGGAGGGPSGVCSQGDSSPGGDGLRLQGAARVHVAGGVVHGANDTASAAGPGAGLVIEDVAGAVTLRGVSVTAGTGLPAALDVVAPPGTVQTYAAEPRGLQVSSPLRQGEAGQIDIEGLAGDLVALFEAPAGTFAPLPGKQGIFLLGAPTVGPVFAAFSPADAWSLPFGTPTLLPAGVDGTTILLQLVVKSGTQVLVEDVASCTILDASF